MTQKAITQKERKEKERSEKKKNTPLIQVDKYSDPISNFISNFKRKFREVKGLTDWIRLFRGKNSGKSEQPLQPENIIGLTKTVIHSDFKNDEKNQTIHKNKKPVLKTNNTIKTQQIRPKNNNLK